MKVFDGDKFTKSTSNGSFTNLINSSQGKYIYIIIYNVENNIDNILFFTIIFVQKYNISLE